MCRKTCLPVQIRASVAPKATGAQTIPRTSDIDTFVLSSFTSLAVLVGPNFRYTLSGVQIRASVAPKATGDQTTPCTLLIELPAAVTSSAVGRTVVCWKTLVGVQIRASVAPKATEAQAKPAVTSGYLTKSMLLGSCLAFVVKPQTSPLHKTVATQPVTLTISIRQ